MIGLGRWQETTYLELYALSFSSVHLARSRGVGIWEASCMIRLPNYGSTTARAER